MFRRLLRGVHFGSFPSIPFFNRAPFARHDIRIPRPSRFFWTTCRLNQRYGQYQYVRFGEPEGPRPPPDGLFRYLLDKWNRFTPAQRIVIAGVGGGAPAFYITHLETVDATGRRRFIFVSRAQEEYIGKMVDNAHVYAF